MLIVVKIGTSSVINNIENIAKQISVLIKKKHEVILVSSGAVGFGKKYMNLSPTEPVKFTRKQIMASIGQSLMMGYYQDAFSKYDITISQVLISKKDIEDRGRYLNIASLLYQSIKIDNLLPIINENDAICLMRQTFTDNDEIAGLIASQLNADKLIILTDVEGLYDDFESKNRKIIHTISSDDEMPLIKEVKSNVSRGGMFSKARIGLKLSKIGITTHIASVLEPDVLNRIVSNEKNIGTSIFPQRRKNIPKKRWMAFFDKEAIKGKVYLNKKLTHIIESNVNKIDSDFAISILPVGIIRSCGSFQKEDAVYLIGYDNNILGIGLAAYSNQELDDYLGLQDKPIFMRHEKMFIS